MKLIRKLFTRKPLLINKSPEREDGNGWANIETNWGCGNEDC